MSTRCTTRRDEPKTHGLAWDVVDLMVRRKRKKPLLPRRKRMKRTARLQSARSWLERYGGRNVLRSYRRWFAVDGVCAIKELRLLGVPISEAQVQGVQQAIESRRLAMRQRIAEQGRLACAAEQLAVEQLAAELVEVEWMAAPTARDLSKLFVIR